MSATAVRTEGLVKKYGPVRALDGVSIEVAAGEIHALIGENGAGKSTFLGILAGRIAPTSGSLTVFDAPARRDDPREARRAGVVAIYQELTIVPARSALHNVFLGAPRRRGGAFLDDGAMRRRYDELAARLGVTIPARALARDRSVADQQSLEIMRALDADARLMLFDEPTAALAPPERGALFRAMRELKAQGVTMVLVSHNLDEVRAIADAVTVFRNGAVVARGRAGELTKERMVAAMLGRRHVASAAAVKRGGGRELMRVEGLTVPGAVENVDLRVHEGEILGLGGLVGSGRTSVLRALSGLEPSARGRLRIGGVETRWPRSPRQALALGIALVPEDRKRQGLVLDRSAMENIALSDLGAVARRGFVSRRRMRARAAVLATRYGFDPARLHDPVRTLSGGTQQKLLLARWAHRRPRVLLCDEPTRGIDVGAKAEILATLQRLAADGIGIVIASSELEEVVAISACVTVLSGGRVAGELAGDITVQDILNAAFQVKETDDAD